MNAYAWTWGPWIAAAVSLASAIAVPANWPTLWPAGIALALLATSFFVGGFIAWASGTYKSALLPMVDILPDATGEVLDAGCGAGRTTVALGRCYRNVQITSLDLFDADYIDGGGNELFNHNVELAGLADLVTACTGDLTRMPFPDARFDAVVSAHAIDHLGDMKSVGVSESHRVLKPGGRLLLIVWVPGWPMFTVANVLCLFLTNRRTWRKIVKGAGFDIRDEGNFNGTWFLLLEKSTASTTTE